MAARSKKPAKPHPDYPLFPHANGQWAKKIKGKLHYFGRWDEPAAALAKWLEEKDDLLAGRTPATKQDGLTLADLANRFLTDKQSRVESGELTHRSWMDYHTSCSRVVDEFGKTRRVIALSPQDFAQLRARLASTRGPVTLKNEMVRIRMLFAYASAARLIEKPVDFGNGFDLPNKGSLRRARSAKGERAFTRRQIRSMVDKASPQLRAMILLGINAGLGNADVGHLPLSALNLKRGWLRYPRPKTGIDRRCPLWPETVAAIKAAIEVRPDPKLEADADLVFVTRKGFRWAKNTKASPLSTEMAKLVRSIGVKRAGLNFYALRHTFQTVGEESGDGAAVQAIMGHSPADRDMSAVYRERMTSRRLFAVAKYVRRWLFTKPKRKSDKPAKSVEPSDKPDLRVVSA